MILTSLHNHPLKMRYSKNPWFFFSFKYYILGFALLKYLLHVFGNIVRYLALEHVHNIIVLRDVRMQFIAISAFKLSFLVKII